MYVQIAKFNGFKCDFVELEERDIYSEKYTATDRLLSDDGCYWNIVMSKLKQIKGNSVNKRKKRKAL